MPRSRMIRPEFFDDEKLASISRDARLTFVGMWVYSDDYGVVKGNIKWLKSRIFPYDDIDNETFTEWLKELENVGCIIKFEHQFEHYYHIKHFNKYQVINRPSAQRNPAPPNINDGIHCDIKQLSALVNAHGVLTEPSLNTNGVCSAKTETETETETESSTSTSSHQTTDITKPPTPPLVRHASQSDGGRKVSVKRTTDNNGRRKRSQATYPDEFLRWWAEYPRKIGKQAALRHWNNLKRSGILPSLETLTQALAWQRHSDQWTRDGGQFIPHPATWLNQGRWEDEPPATLKSNTRRPCPCGSGKWEDVCCGSK